MKRLTVSHKDKADAKEAFREAKSGRYAGHIVERVYPLQWVYTRWEFDIEVRS